MKKSLVLLLTTLALSVSAQQLSKYEYWFDHDTNQRLKVATTDGDISLTVNTTQLATGVHSFNFRVKDSEGRWSSPLTTYFLRTQIGQAIWTYEWWFDSDHEKRITGKGSGNVLELSLSAQSLKPGIHSFNFRAQDEDGRWSIPITTYFMRLPNSHDPEATYTYEYWIDDTTDQKQTGFSTDGLIVLQVDASSLTAGVHFLALRMRDDSGNWAAPLYHYFVKPHTSTTNLVNGYYYWFNDHVEDAQLVRLDTPASPLMLEVDLPTNNLEQEVTRENITMLTTPDGQQQLAMKNVLSMQFVDQRGKWSEVMTDTFATAVGDRVVSLTPFIQNPEADEQWKGWITQGNRNIATDGQGNVGADPVSARNYFRLGNGKVSEMRQTVSGLPAGTYMVSSYGKAASGSLTMSVAGYTVDFPADGEENGWSQRTVTFVTDGGPFDIAVSASGIPPGQWACIDGFSMTVNGIVDKAGTVCLNDVQISSVGNPSAWNEPGCAVRLQLTGHYDNLKGRAATIYYSIDNGTPMRLADGITPNTQFAQDVECFFRENASPHTVSLYGKDTEGMISEKVVLEIGNITRGCTVENLPQMAIYTGKVIEIDSLALRDSRTDELLEKDKDYSLIYNNNVDDGQASIIVEGIYPRYMGRHELHFAIKSYIADEEMAILRTFYDQTAGDSLWTRKWNLKKDQVLSDELTGVSVKNRHITAIHLRANRLTGQLPDVVFSLPQLQTLNVEDNTLSGTINTSAIKPTLRELLLARNGLSSLNGVIPATVTNLSLGGQTINEVSELHLSQPALQMPSLPNIGLYNHEHQDFSRQADIRLMTSSYNDTPLAILSLRNDEWLLRNDEWGSRVYRQAQNDTIYCTDDTGNHFRIALTFEPGDANFDGLVNVQDLSAVVLYCLNNYQATFNYTAANLWEDERVNVQDAVCLVNILLESIPPAANQTGSHANRLADAANEKAMLTIANGQLTLSSSVPVSAFDIIIKGVQPQDVTSMIEPLGFMISKRQHDNGTHIVGFSPMGYLLPVGKTDICTVAMPKSQVTHAILADDHAKGIAAIVTGTTGISEIGSSELEVTIRNGMIVVMATKAVNNAIWTLYSTDGSVIDSGQVDHLPVGISRIPCHVGKKGIVILRFSADQLQPIVRKISNK